LDNLVPTGERWGSLTIPSHLAFAEGLFYFYEYFMGKEETIINCALCDIRRGAKIEKIAKY